MADIDREILRRLTLSLSGATAAGITLIGPVDDAETDRYTRWLADGCHGRMTYLERYDDVRRNPALLLDGAQTLIIAAFSYANRSTVDNMRRRGLPTIAEYALCADYHTELRRRLTLVTDELTHRYGGTTRICIDTAPLRERYWAQRAGLGFIGINNQLIIPGHGSHFFLGTILWTGTTDDGSDAPCTDTCLDCGACVDACPGHALRGDGTLDARRCLSYLTIENRDPLPPDFSTGGRLYGCDTCREVCPHEVREPDSPIFPPTTDLADLTPDDWQQMTPGDYKRLTRNLAMNRIPLAKLRDTLLHL